jgi:hypothetical protein
MTDASTLNRIQTNNLLTWDELHSYKERVQLPWIPKEFPAELLPSNMCLRPFTNLERCLQYGMEREHQARPYERLPACKHLWLTMERCVIRRDFDIGKKVTSWEKNRVSLMEMPEKRKYVERVMMRSFYFKYLSSSSNSAVSKFHEYAYWTVIDRVIAIKNSEGWPLSESEKEREKYKREKSVTLSTVTRTISKKLMMSRA